MHEKVKQLLDAPGLTQYLQAFVDNDVDDDVLEDLSDADLRELGVSLGHRKKLLKRLAAQPETRTVHAAPVTVKEAERRQLTVMFCDLVSSTELSTQLDVEVYREVIASYQNETREALIRYDGYIARYMGDGLLVYFGYPQAHEDDAERAIRAALAIVEAVTRVTAPTGRKLEVRIGIATGPVVAGDIIGDGASEEHAVLGETPNLAARLQALAKPGVVLIATATRTLCGRLFELEATGELTVKGFAEPVSAWRVKGERVTDSRFEATRTTEGMPIVGRDSEIMLLLDRWERALDREGQVVYLSGEPGIGKSRLMHTLRQRINDTPHGLIQFQCSPYYASSAFYPFIDQLQRLAGIAADDDTQNRRDKLDRWVSSEDAFTPQVLPLILNLFSIPLDENSTPTDLSAQAQKERTAELLIERIVYKAAHTPLLIVFEDAHWADPTSLDTLGRLISRVSSLPILVLVTHRPEFDPPWPAGGQITAHSLARLGRRQVSELILGVTSAKQLPPAIIDDIAAKTDGIPLFVEELTKAVIESDMLRELDDRFVIDGAFPALSIPSTLRDSLVSRLDRLGPVKEVAQIASVIGREFSAALLCAVVRLDDQTLERALGQLVEAELIQLRDGQSERIYVFKHALVQEAAYDSFLRRRREQLHAEIVATLEDQFPEIVTAEPELLAHHCDGSGQARVALEYWRAAAQAALEQSAYQESLSHLDSARQSLSKFDDKDDSLRAEMEIEVARGGVLMVSEGYLSSETGAAFSRARELAEQFSDQHKLFAALRGLHGIRIVRAELDPALQIARQCLHIAEAERENETIALASRLVGQTLFLKGNLTEAAQHLERSLSLWSVGDAADVAALVHGGGYRLMTHAFLSHVLWLQGYPDRALALSRCGLEQAKLQSGVFSITATMYFLVWLLGWRRDFAEQRTLTQALYTLADEHKINAWTSPGEILNDWPTLSESGSAAAIDAVQAQLQAVRSAIKLQTPFKLGLLASALSGGELAHELIAQAMSITETTGERWSEPELHRIKGELLANDGATLEITLEQFERSLSLAREQGARAWQLRTAISLARVWVQNKRPGDAREVLTPVYETFDEGFEGQDMREARELLAKLG